MHWHISGQIHNKTDKALDVELDPVSSMLYPSRAIRVAVQPNKVKDVDIGKTCIATVAVAQASSIKDLLLGAWIGMKCSDNTVTITKKNQKFKITVGN